MKLSETTDNQYIHYPQKDRRLLLCLWMVDSQFMSICQTKINPRLPSFMGTFIYYVYRFVKITDNLSSLLMLPYRPYLSFKSRANQLPRNRSKCIHHLLSFYIKYKFTNVNSMWFIWKSDRCQLLKKKSMHSDSAVSVQNGKLFVTFKAW